MYGILAQVSITRSGLRTAVSKHTTDDLQRNAGGGRGARKTMPQIVKADILQLRRFSNALPRLLQVHDVSFIVLADNHVLIIFYARKVLQNFLRRSIEGDCFGALSVGFVVFEQ